MATKILGLRTLIFFVEDLQKAAEWYTEVLGFEPYFNTPYYVGFNVGGYELGLHPAKDNQQYGDSSSAYWGVENVQEVYESLLAAGCTVWEKPNDVGDGIVVASVKDPWGNVFGIICNPHFKLS